MNWATLLTGGLTTVIGLALGTLGFGLVDTEVRSVGPLPLKTPTDWTIVAIGLALAAIGSVLAGAGLFVLGVQI